MCHRRLSRSGVAREDVVVQLHFCFHTLSLRPQQIGVQRVGQFPDFLLDILESNEVIEFCQNLFGIQGFGADVRNVACFDGHQLLIGVLRPVHGFLVQSFALQVFDFLKQIGHLACIAEVLAFGVDHVRYHFCQ